MKTLPPLIFLSFLLCCLSACQAENGGLFNPIESDSEGVVIKPVDNDSDQLDSADMPSQPLPSHSVEAIVTEPAREMPLKEPPETQSDESAETFPLQIEKVAGLPIPLAGHTLVQQGSDYFVMGGDNGLIKNSQVLYFDLNEGTDLDLSYRLANAGEYPLDILANISKYRQSNLFAQNQKMYKGSNRGTGGLIRLSTIYEMTLDKTRWEWEATPVLELPLAGAPALVPIKEKVYAFNGWSSEQVAPDGSITNTEPPRDIIKIDLTNQTTETIGKLPSEMENAAYAVYQDMIYIMGGSGFNGRESFYSTDILRFNPQTSMIEKIGDLPHGLSQGGYSAEGTNALTFKDKIYLVGGEGQDAETQESQLYADILEIDPLSGAVKKVGELPSPRSQVALFSFQNKLYIVGGHDGKSALVDILEVTGF